MKIQIIVDLALKSYSSNHFRFLSNFYSHFANFLKFHFAILMYLEAILLNFLISKFQTHIFTYFLIIDLTVILIIVSVSCSIH